MSKRRILRFAIALAVVMAIVGIGNHVTLTFASRDERAILIEGGVGIVALVSLWTMKSLPFVQVKSRLGLVELLTLGLYYVLISAIIPMSCDPVRMCLGGGGGYEQFASLWGYLVALAAVGVVAISEELFARGYVIGELLPSLQHYGSRRLRLGGVLLSGATFLLMHAFVLGPIWGYFPSTQWYAIQILAGGLTYATVYIYTKRNLALTILMHFYYDAYAPLLSSSSLSAVFLLVTIFPAIIVLALHFQLAKTRRTELNLGLESPVMNKALSASAA